MSKYTDNKRAFTFKADSELRGLNATVAIIAKLYHNGDKETIATFAEDALTISYIEDKQFIELAKQSTPQYFTTSGQMCTLKKVYKTDENFAKFVDFESIEGCDDRGEYAFFKMPVYKWTTESLYNFAKRAKKASDKQSKKEAKLSELSTEELRAELARRG